MSETGGNSMHNLSSKRKKKKKYVHHDFQKKNAYHSGMFRGNSLVSENALPLLQHSSPASSLLSEHGSKESFNLKCGQEPSCSKTVASSSCRRKNHREEATSSNVSHREEAASSSVSHREEAASSSVSHREEAAPSYVIMDEKKCGAGLLRQNFKGSLKQSNINKTTYGKKGKGFMERTQSRLPKEKTHMEQCRHIKESKMENIFYNRKMNCPERVGRDRCNLESNCSINVSEVASDTSALQNGQRDDASHNQTQSDSVLTNQTSLKTGKPSANHITRVREIAGFYYDHEKKRYFKILPGHTTAANSWITSETIKEKESEEKRRNLLKQQITPNVINGTSLSAVNILQSMQEGVWNHTQYTRYSTECRVQAMNVIPTSVYEPSTDLPITGITPAIQCVELDRSLSKVMVVLSSGQLSRIMLGSISGEHCTKKELLLQKWQDVYTRNSSTSQISSAKLINIDQQDDCFPGSLYVLCSCSGDYSNTLQLVKCPSNQDCFTDPVSFVGYRFESPGEAISSYSWNSNPRFPAHLCIGFSKEAEIIELISTSRQRLDTDRKEVLSQVFAKQQPVIYLGLKQGYISSYDLRAPRRPVHTMMHKSPVKKTAIILQGGCVCCLSLLNDENYLLAGSSNGTIKLWDLRQRTVVNEMYGHCNEYKYLPVNIDSSESFVYAVGQDDHTRLWSLQDGSHLKTIPSPVPRPEKASAVFSVNWGSSGLPGIMIGAMNKLYWYPF